jgi:uncharacterized membrane protein YqaE (UPF0057 family)
MQVIKRNKILKKTVTMKNKILFSLAIAGLLLASCGITKNNDFSARKYTKFRKGEANIAEAPVQLMPEKSGPEITIISAVSENTDVPSLVSTPVKTTVSDKQASETIIASNNTSFTKKGSANKTEIKLKSLRSKVLARFADKQNTTAMATDQVVLVILAIFIPPLAVALARGIGNEFWIDLLLTILFFIPGMIYAILIVLDAI